MAHVAESKALAQGSHHHCFQCGHLAPCTPEWLGVPRSRDLRSGQEVRWESSLPPTQVLPGQHSPAKGSYHVPIESLPRARQLPWAPTSP